MRCSCICLKYKTYLHLLHGWWRPVIPGAQQRVPLSMRILSWGLPESHPLDETIDAVYAVIWQCLQSSDARPRAIGWLPSSGTQPGCCVRMLDAVDPLNWQPVNGRTSVIPLKLLSEIPANPLLFVAEDDIKITRFPFNPLRKSGYILSNRSIQIGSIQDKHWA